MTLPKEDHQSPAPGSQRAQQQKNGTQKQQQQAGQSVSPAGPGDERTPDKPIGQVAYAEHSGKREGGAGEPETSQLEPEKQGGIGGP